ncbi:MAG: type IX secretion system sortase PorU, partial [Bacteroidaceae bacterium]|nr:type IX secretion system sortase PorU [Bacteroidaceae bacterium]
FRGSAPNGNANFKIATNRSGIKVWCVTTPSKIIEYPGAYSDGYYTVTAPASYNEEFVAVDVNAKFPSVEVVGNVPNQNLHSLGQTDMVIIVPSNGLFLSQAERLAQIHRDTDSLTVAVVTAEQVYNEFSSGTPDATAYRRLMKMFYDRAANVAEAPKYLLLMGDSYADNRLITNKSIRQDDFLLCYPSQNSVSAVSSYVLEDYFAFLDDSEGTAHKTDKIDISVGRIPAHSLAELTPVINKIINYANNSEAGSWQNNIVLLGDDGDPTNPNSHMRDAENIAKVVNSNFPLFMLRRIYWDDYPMVALATGNSYPAVTAAIKEQLDEGALIVNYSGHGSANLLSHEMAWKSSDMAECTSPRLPLWVTASCDISPFDIGDGSLGEAAILNPVGAAVALFTTTRTVYQQSNALINQRFMRNVLSRDENGRASTIGDAVRRAKVELISGGGDLTENKLQYVLLGDPALRLKVPGYEVVVDRFADKDAAIQSTASAGGKIIVEGHIRNAKGEKADDFNGVVSPTMFDYEQEIVTKNNTNLGAFTYHAHKNKLYSGSDSVVSGNFKLTIPVPMDISYSDETGLINLYAVTHDGKRSAQGRYDNFTIGGTSPDISDDKKGPEIKMYLNKPSFRDGDEVNATPCLFVELRDPDGINTVGSGIGHDIMAIVDNDAAYSFNLNGSFVSSVGDYTSGHIVFPLTSLPAGEHTLLLRAWDLLNNSSTAIVNFTVVPDLAPDFVELDATPNPVHSGETVTFMLTHDRPQSEITVTIELFDFQGRILWSNTENAVGDSTVYTYTWDVTAAGGQPITTGVYLYRAKISSAGGSEQTKTGKIVILNNK